MCGFTALVVLEARGAKVVSLPSLASAEVAVMQTTEHFSFNLSSL